MIGHIVEVCKRSGLKVNADKSFGDGVEEGFAYIRGQCGWETVRTCFEA